MRKKPLLILALGVFLSFSVSTSFSQTTAIIDNGTIQLGVHDEGHLNVPGGAPSSGTGTTFVGLRYIPTGAEATAPGCLCEGWGAADGISGVSGSANESIGGVQNITVESFTADANTAVSVVNIGGVMRVTHDYHPSLSPFLYEATVTIENISGATIDLLYRRTMDWDIEPTAFAEFVTIQGGASATSVLFTSDNGFASSDPLSGPSSIIATGDFVDSGPADHGALFDFGFGELAPGDMQEFTIFYGAASTESDAIAALTDVGAEVFSLGEPNTTDGPTLGTPNTFIFGFKGVGGVALSSDEGRMFVNSANPLLGVPITLSRVDNRGHGSASTRFIRIYTLGSSVDLTAPATAPNGNPFSHWINTGVLSTTSQTLNVTMKKFQEVIAVYDPPGLPGDANEDSAVNLSDIFQIGLFIVGNISDISDNADVDGNGVVDILDAVLIYQFTTGIIDCFPIEAGCGDATKAKRFQNLNVQAPTFTWSTPEEEASLITLPITLVSGTTRGFDLTLSFNPDLLSVEDVTITGAPEDWMNVHQVDDGKLHLIAIGSSPINTGQIGSVTFRMNKKGYSSLKGVLHTAEGLTQTLEPLSVGELPDRYALKQNYPNPFNPTTQIQYTLPEASSVELTVYDALGRTVRVLVSEFQEAGQYEIAFDAKDLPSGVYLYRLQAGSFEAIRRMLLVK